MDIIRKDMDIIGKIKSIKYISYLANKSYNIYDLFDLENALKSDSYFLLNVDASNRFAISWWVSPKRTRSYPYARIYNTLPYLGKRITIIPIYKDEGSNGDRDFLQWDTVSLMSLLGINVIISYYKSADKNTKYKNKITKQNFDIEQIRNEIEKLKYYQSDPLHWNLEQMDKIISLSETALESYNKISILTGVSMHSKKAIFKRINLLKENKSMFMSLSRKNAKEAQKRERNTLQPKENINEGEKSIITISNYLGGYYYFTVDEARIIENENIINLVEAKHSKNSLLPSIDDIKDGLVKMILFSNLKKVKIEKKKYNVIPILKLTTSVSGNLNSKQIDILNILYEEAKINGFFIEHKGGI